MPGPDTPPPTDQFGPDKPPLADKPIGQSAPPPPSTPADPLDPPAKITWLHPDSEVPLGQPSFGYTPPLVVVDEPAVPPARSHGSTRMRSLAAGWRRALPHM